MRILLLMVMTVLLLGACKPKVPSRYLQPDDMENFLYDYYVAQGLSDASGPMNGDMEYRRRYHFEALLRKYGLTEAEFDSSLVYYCNNMERMKVIYGNIQKRLSEEALELGASEGEVERFTQSLSGDTADVWEGRRSILLTSTPPYHVEQFCQEADTSFHKGDSFMFTLSGKYLSSKGYKNATVYLAVTYENDSVIAQTSNITGGGPVKVRINACPEKAKRFEGYVYMARREKNDDENSISLLFLDYIQLVRFHHHTTDDIGKKATDESGEDAGARSTVEADDSTAAEKPKVRRLGEHIRQLNQ